MKITKLTINFVSFFFTIVITTDTIIIINQIEVFYLHYNWLVIRHNGDQIIKARVMHKDGLKFHLYHLADDCGKIYYCPQETDNYGKDEAVKHPLDVYSDAPLPNEVLVASGSYNACRRWFYNHEHDAISLSRAALQSLTTHESISSIVNPTQPDTLQSTYQKHLKLKLH